MSNKNFIQKKPPQIHYYLISSPIFGMLIALALLFYGQAWFDSRWHPDTILWTHLYLFFVILPPLIIFIFEQFQKPSVFIKIILLGLSLSLFSGSLFTFNLLTLTAYQQLMMADIHLYIFLILCLIPFIVLHGNSNNFTQSPYLPIYLLLIILISGFVLTNSFSFENNLNNFIMIMIAFSIVYLFKKQQKNVYLRLIFFSLILILLILSAQLYQPMQYLSPSYSFIIGSLLFIGVLQSVSHLFLCSFYQKEPNQILVWHYLTLLAFIIASIYTNMALSIAACLLLIHQTLTLRLILKK